MTSKYSKRKESSGRLTEGKWGNLSEESLARAGELDRIANDIGHSPAQIATNWIRQQADAMIPIFGATNVDQLTDNLGCLEFTLSEEQMKRIENICKFEIGFPIEILDEDEIHDLVFGKDFLQLLNHRRRN